MEEAIQYNEEQLQLLKLAISDTSCGICLFQCYDSGRQTEIASELAENTPKKCAVINIAELREEQLPDDVGKMRDLLEADRDAEVVIICNLQICGFVLGDETYIYRFNYMRDQLLNMGKVWVFGMSPYFAALLSSKARDLYSCIMQHYIFREDDDSLLQDGFQEDVVLYGESRIDALHYRELKMDLEGREKTAGTEQLCRALEVWNRLFAGDIVRDGSWISIVLDEFAGRLEELAFNGDTWQRYIEVIKAYNHLKQYERALEAALQLRGKAGDYPDGFRTSDMMRLERAIGSLYMQWGRLDEAEGYLKRAYVYYSDDSVGYSKDKLWALENWARYRFFRNESYEAERMYQEMVRHAIEEFGEECPFLPLIYNNQGVVYFEMGRFHEAMECLRKARGMAEKTDHYGLEKSVRLSMNMGIVYGRMGQYEPAVQYLEEAVTGGEGKGTFLSDQAMRLHLYSLIIRYCMKSNQLSKGEKYEEKAKKLKNSMENQI